jgi:hypothetical protein
MPETQSRNLTLSVSPHPRQVLLPCKSVQTPINIDGIYTINRGEKEFFAGCRLNVRRGGSGHHEVASP